MPELKFEVLGVEAAARGLTPLLHFKLRLTSTPPEQAVQAVILNAQIQLQPPQRSYAAAEIERLLELFGPPEQWGQSLRNRLWAHATATLGAFTGSAETILPVPCTYDLNIASAKYFHALEDGDVSLLFLFSGSVFSLASDGRLQVEPISWNSECVYRMPVTVWQELMDRHYPNTAWLSLPRDIFERLYAYRRRHCLGTWEQTVEQLLRAAEEGNTQYAIRNTPQEAAAA